MSDAIEINVTGAELDRVILDLERDQVRSSLYDFVLRFAHVVIPTAPKPGDRGFAEWTASVNWHVERQCAVLQSSAQNYWAGGRARDVVSNVPPGTLKSTIFSVMFPAWTWAVAPWTRHICVSYTDSLAMSLSRKCRDVVTSEKWRRLFPEVRLRDDQNAVGEFANTRGGLRKCVGTGAAIVGIHADFISLDDPIDPSGAKSEADRERACAYVPETLVSRLLNKGYSPTFLVMQRLHQKDPASIVIENGGVTGELVHVNLPAEVLEDEPNPVRPALWRRHYVDGLLDPKRLSRETLDRFRATMGRYAYSGQMLQNPVPLSGGMFDTSKLVAAEPPPLESFRALMRGWDKAGTSAKDARGRGARTAGVLVGEDATGRFWILDVVRGQWGSTDREAVIRSTTIADNARARVRVAVEMEPGSGGKESAENTVRNLSGYSVVVDRPTGRKELRADPLSVQVGAGNVLLAAGRWNHDYLEEMRHFPDSDTLDQIDASAMTFNVLTREKNTPKIGGWSLLA